MTLEQVLYLIPYLASSVISLAVAYYAWRRRSTNGAVAFAVYALAQGVATFGFVLETASPTLSAKLFWDDLQWPPFYIFPVAALIFVQQYTNRTGKYQQLVWRIAVAVCGLLAVYTLTGGIHGGTRIDPVLTQAEPFDLLTYEIPTVILVTTLLPYLMMLYVTGNLFVQVLRSERVYRAQMITIFIGMLIPAAGSTAILAGFTFGGQRDITPILFALGNLVIAWSLFRYGLFDLVPVARDTVLEHLRDAVIVLDQQNRVVDLNPAGRELVGAGRSVIGLSIAEALEKWVGIVEQFITVEQCNTEITVTASEPKHYNLVITPLKDKKGAIKGRLVLLRDITESVNARLEIEAARKAAVEANETKSRFLANMSHELRTPLNAILNFSAFVADGVLGPVTDEQVEVLNHSISSGKHLLSLINDVLDITKIEAGMMQLFIQEVDFNEALAGTISVAKGLVQEKNITLITSVDDKLPTSFGDKRRLRQVFLNLVSNAVKFTPEGSITIQAHAQNGGIQIDVCDTGIGIAEEDHTLVFELFRQVNKHEMVETVAGTGLGMPISKYFVESHGGRLWFESAPNKGTTFHVFLPTLTRDEAVTLNQALMGAA